MEAALFTDMSLNDMNMYYDEGLRARFHAALYDFDQFAPGQRRVVMEDLRNYMKTYYGVDMDDVFDWESYRDDVSDEL